MLRPAQLHCEPQSFQVSFTSMTTQPSMNRRLSFQKGHSADIFFSNAQELAQNHQKPRREKKQIGKWLQNKASCSTPLCSKQDFLSQLSTQLQYFQKHRTSIPCLCTSEQSKTQTSTQQDVGRPLSDCKCTVRPTDGSIMSSD